MSDYSEITARTEDGVTTLTLDRPDRLNAWTDVMGRELRAAVVAAGNDPACRCIVITGAGRGFCAGADMERLSGAAEKGAEPGFGGGPEGEAAFPNAPGPEVAEEFPGRFGYFYACPKPIIAAVNGPCAGIGMVMALYADMRFAAAEAKFTTAFAARGLVAEHGMAWLMPRLIGEAAALDLLMTARKITGEEAERLGLVNKALPGEALSEHVAGVAWIFAQEVSPRSAAVMKRQVRASYAQSFAASLASADAEMQKSFAAPDFKEGVQSFVEKRAPAFPGL